MRMQLLCNRGREEGCAVQLPTKLAKTAFSIVVAAAQFGLHARMQLRPHQEHPADWGQGAKSTSAFRSKCGVIIFVIYGYDQLHF